MEKRKKIRGDDPKLKEMKKPKGFRQLNISGRIFFWTTDGYECVIKTNQKNINVTTSEIHGSIRDPYSHNPVTPSDLSDYIVENWSKFE